MILIQSTEQNHKISFFGKFSCCCAQGIHHRLGNFFCTPIHRTSGSVTFRINYLVTIKSAHTIEWRYHIFYLQFRRTASFVQQADSIVTYYQYTLIFRVIKRQQRGTFFLDRCVFQKHNTLITNLTGSLIMLFTCQRTIRFLTIHRRAEYQAKNTGGFIIHCAHRHLTFLQHPEIRLSQIIIVEGKCTF